MTARNEAALTMEGHECVELKRSSKMGPGRELWVGKLLKAPVWIAPENQEVFCFHITTPSKGKLVFLLNAADVVEHGKLIRALEELLPS